VEKLTASDIRGIRGETSQTAFAALLGISQAALHYWETGTNSPTGPAQRLLCLIRDDKDGRILRFLRGGMIGAAGKSDGWKGPPETPKWERLVRSRKGCQEVVVAPRGKRRTPYLVRCGARAEWRMASFGMSMHRCDGHKKLTDAVVRCAQEAAKRITPPAGLIL
jgi:hypothetical protein